jgi:hypothetical protein
MVDATNQSTIFLQNGQIRTAKSKKPPEPFQGAHPDFIKYESVEDGLAAESPSRISLLDDLCFYHSVHSRLPQLTSDPRSIIVLAQKLVASEMLLFLEYHRHLITVWPGN